MSAASENRTPSRQAAMLGTICACRSGTRFPARRIRWPLRRPLTRVARFGRNVAITPIDNMLPLKVLDSPFFPRISDGGIAPLVTSRLVSVIGKERKS